MHLLCTSHTLTCTHTNGELQKNRHGNHKAQMEKRHGEPHTSVFNSHLAMKQQNDVLQEINSHRTHIHPNATMGTFFPFFLRLTDVAINLTVSFCLCWSFWRASGAYLTFIKTQEPQWQWTIHLISATIKHLCLRFSIKPFWKLNLTLPL